MTFDEDNVKKGALVLYCCDGQTEKDLPWCVH